MFSLWSIFGYRDWASLENKISLLISISGKLHTSFIFSTSSWKKLSTNFYVLKKQEPVLLHMGLNVGTLWYVLWVSGFALNDGFSQPSTKTPYWYYVTSF